MGKKLYFLIGMACIGGCSIEGMKRNREEVQTDEQVRKKPRLERQNAEIVTREPKSLKTLCAQYFIKKLGQATGSTVDAVYQDFISTVPIHLQKSIKAYFRSHYGWRLRAWSKRFVEKNSPTQSEMVVLSDGSIEFSKPCIKIFLPESSIVFVVNNVIDPCATVELYFGDSMDVKPGCYDHALFPVRCSCFVQIVGITYEDNGAKLLMHMADETAIIHTCYSFESVLFARVQENSKDSPDDLRMLLQSNLFTMLSDEEQFEFSIRHNSILCKALKKRQTQ